MSDVDAYLGNNWTTGATVVIDQYRNGTLIVSNYYVVMWKENNGGTAGDGHGRYSFAASASQWKVGDYLCLPRGNIITNMNLK